MGDMSTEVPGELEVADMVRACSRTLRDTQETVRYALETCRKGMNVADEDR